MTHTTTIHAGSEDLIRAVVRELAGFGDIGSGVSLNGHATFQHVIDVPDAQKYLTASLGALAGHHGYVLFHDGEEYRLMPQAPEQFMTRSRLARG